MRITTLGPLAVDGRPVRGERLAAVVRELAAARGKSVSTGALAEAVWRGSPPDDAPGAVQALIARVRRLGVPVLAVPGGYRMPADEVETDVAAARTLAGQARAALVAGDAAAARRAADEARALFGEAQALFGEVPATELRLFGEVAEFRLFGEVVAVRAEAALAGAGPFDDADLRLLASRTPPDEPATALLVRVLAAQGREAEALELIERLRAELADRYGTDPSPVIADVHLALLRGELGPARPGGDAAVGRPPMLPGAWRRPGTTLVGRGEDLVAVTAALEVAPLVTIVATGGAGKTRLAAEVARRAAGAVRVVELAGVREAEEVLPAVLAALGGAESAPAGRERRVLAPEERLRAVAPELDGLVVFDNCEHVLAAAADVVADLLDAAPEVAVLATSRAPLGLPGEAVHRLGTLPDAEALTLLEARARAGGAVPTWDAERALRLCHRLDNLPLALELAAARLRSMPIDDVLAGLDDRFALLDAALRGLPERHASLWAMVDWSRELLAPAERELLRRLAVIPAPFSAVAAAAVAGRPEVARGLAVLVEQSLLVLEQEFGVPRYRMLETVREYGEARLDDRGPAMRGLVAWARTAGVALFGGFLGPRQLDSVAAVAREQENLLAALRWALETEDEPAAVDIAAPLFQLWSVRGLHVEVATWARQLVRADDAAARTRSAVLRGAASGRPLPDADRLAWVGVLVAVNGGITGSLRLAALSARALRCLLAERGGEVSPRNAILAELLPLFGSLDTGRAMAAANRMTAHDDPYVRAMGFFGRAAYEENQGRPELSGADARRSYEEFEALGDHWGMAMAAQAIGGSMTLRGSEESVEWLRRGVRHMDLLGAAQDARSLRVALDVQLALGGDEEAERRLLETTAVRGEEWDDAQAYLGLAHLAFQRHRFAEALSYGDEVARSVRGLSSAQPQPWVIFRVAVAMLYLAADAENADDMAAGLLTQARGDALSAHDVPVVGAWAIGGAGLALHRNEQEAARELWELGMRVGANIGTLFPPGEDKRLAAALGEDRRTGTGTDQPAARIRQLMDDLLD